MREQRLLLSLLFIFACLCAKSQNLVSGIIKDSGTNEVIVGAIVQEKGTTNATVTDIDGKFVLTIKGEPPYLLTVSFIGYENTEFTLSNPSGPVTIRVKSKEVKLKDVEVTGSRVSEKQKQAPLTV